MNLTAGKIVFNVTTLLVDILIDKKGNLCLTFNSNVISVPQKVFYKDTLQEDYA